MEDRLTASQFYADLVEAARPKSPPERAFTLYGFAEDAELDRQKAQRILDAQVKAGTLCGGKFVTDGHPRWWYWEPEEA